jgi:hypothetical protein
MIRKTKNSNAEPFRFTIGSERQGGSRIGRADPPFIYLNLDNEFIQECLDTENVNALCVVIAALMVEHDTSMESIFGTRQRFLPEWHEFSKVLAAVPRNDIRELLPLLR